MLVADDVFAFSFDLCIIVKVDWRVQFLGLFVRHVCDGL